MSDKDSWKEVFSDGVYKLKIDGSILRYEFLSSDATEYPKLLIMEFQLYGRERE